MHVVERRTDSCPSRLKWHLQTLACAFVLLPMGCGFFISVSIVLYILLYTRFYPLVILYYIWVWYDTDSRASLERRSPRVREWAVWRYARDYFPARLVKTAELDPNLNYIFCTFPHGVLGLGTGINFFTNANKVDTVFPNHKSYLATVNYHFKLFYIRELGHALGFCPATPKTVSNVLSRPNSVLVLIIGGSSEAFYSRPGKYTFFLSQRKGFVKMALKHGAPLVPVITFGEPDVYDQVHIPEGSWLSRCQEFIRKITGVAPVILYGNGPLPYRRPTTTVVGKPLPLEKTLNPTQEQIDDLHQKFTTELIKLFEENKRLYLENHEKVHLVIK